MLNKVILVGRVTRKPELRQTKNGFNFAFLSVALNSRKKEGDEFVKHTEFVSVKVFGRTAENVCQYLDKGRTVSIEGKLSSYEGTDDSGKKTFSLSVIGDTVLFLDRGDQSTEGGIPQKNWSPPSQKKEWRPPTQPNYQPPLDDDIPF